MIDTAIFMNTFIRDDMMYRAVKSSIKQIPDSRLYITDNGRMNKEKEVFYKKLKSDGHFVEVKDFNYPWRVSFNEKLDKLQDERYIIKVDDDFYFDKKVEFKKFIEADNEIGLIGGKVWHYHRDEPSPFIYNIEKLKDGHYRWHRIKDLPDCRVMYCDAVPDFWVARREIFSEVKMSDDFDIGQGDHEDFFQKIFLLHKNWKVAYTPEVVAHHEKSNNTEEYNHYRHKNNFKFNKKWKVIK